ncbi:MAG: signal peptidase I [Planctomycetota bacterium]
MTDSDAQADTAAGPAPAADSGETYVSTAPETSALSSGSKGADSKKKPERSHPWRDNIEAVAISIVTIVLFKYFVLEAYKIPTGSMQPTLMGNEETGIHDRVIVDKLSYHFRDPERFEIAVFKYPLDSAKNFIKRIIGMPGELLYLKGGDAWIRRDGETEDRVLRRPRPIQNAQLRLLDTRGEWRPTRAASAAWTIDARQGGDLIVAKGRGEATFPRGSIKDDYLDGYPEGMKADVDDRNKNSNWNDVSDLRVRADVEVDAGCREVAFVVHEGRRRFRFVLPGPAAPEGESLRIEAIGIEDESGQFTAGPGGTIAELETPRRLVAGRLTTVEAQNLNDLLTLRVDGEDILTLEVPPVREPGPARVTIAVEAPDGAGATLDDLKIWRDIYYTTDPTRQKVTRWQIPPGNYVVLGDNSQDSSDGRDWTLARFRVDDGEGNERIVRGNQREGMVVRPDTNPLYLPSKRSAETIFFRDDLGERHVFDADEVQRIADESAALVPRDLIRGRAVLVVWPLSPWRGVYRWKWVR